jgi:hypothetical protein
VAEELAFPRAESKATESPSDARGTFPAGTAVAALAVWFLLSRLLVRIATERPLAGRIAVFTGVLGAVLGIIAMLLHIGDDLREKSVGLRALAIARLSFVLPTGLLVSSTMIGEPAAWQQWAGLWGTAGTIVLSLVPAIVRARGMWVPRITLLLLLIGELVELGWPPAHLAFAPGTFWPLLFQKLGAVSEACAFIGAMLALTWSIFSTRYTSGWWRARMFLPLPIVTSAVMSFLMTTLPPRIVMAAARYAFGVRFDLIWSDDGRIAAFSMPGLIVYLLIPELLIGASAVSVAAIGVDKGAAARRALGWLAILFAGFGALRLAGPMDPIRLVLVSLGTILLERAVVRELEDRKQARVAS